MIANEQSTGGNHPGGFNLQLKNARDAARGALQPQGARATTGIFRATNAAEEKNKQREQNFAAKPSESSNDSKRVLAQSFHPQVSNAADTAVNS
jgi:hypothetical protein